MPQIVRDFMGITFTTKEKFQELVMTDEVEMGRVYFVEEVTCPILIGQIIFTESDVTPDWEGTTWEQIDPTLVAGAYTWVRRS